MEILYTVLPVIITLGIGVLIRSTKLISEEGIDSLKKVVVNITLPAVMFSAFATTDYTAKNVLVVLLVFGICFAAWGLGNVPGMLSKNVSSFMPFLSTGFEAGMLGYSLYALLYGRETIGTFAILDLGQVLFVFTIYKILLGAKQKGSVNAKSLLSDMFHSPVFIAILLGVFFGATGIYSMPAIASVTGVIEACTEFVGAPTAAIILMSIGYDLVFKSVPWKAVFGSVVTRAVIMVLMRIVAGFAVRMMGFDDRFDFALNIMFILPAPYVLPVFSSDEEQRTFVSSSLSIMTVISIVGFVVLTFIKGV